MCGRTSCSLSAGEIQNVCTYKSRQGDELQPNWKNEGKYTASFNKAPMTYSPTLICGDTEKATRTLEPMRWGLVPSWQRETACAVNMINCRSDTITEKKTFSGLLKSGKRCVVLAEGFFEWKSIDGAKQPYFIQQKQSSEQDGHKSLLRMAGLFDDNSNQQEEGVALRTYTVITVDAHPSLRWLHHRMPAVLETEDAVDQWLNPKVHWEKALALLRSVDSLTWFPVSNIVNSVKNDAPECVAKITLKKKYTASQNLMSSWLQGGNKRKSNKSSASAESSKKCKI